MIIVNDRDITLSRGDYGAIKLSLNSGGEPYILGDGDTLLFTVKKTTREAEGAIEKRILPNGTSDFVIELLPEDTKDLPTGEYVWDIRIMPKNGKVHTPMFHAKFKLVRTVGNNE